MQRKILTLANLKPIQWEEKTAGPTFYIGRVGGKPIVQIHENKLVTVKAKYRIYVHPDNVSTELFNNTLPGAKKMAEKEILKYVKSQSKHLNLFLK